MWHVRVGKWASRRVFQLAKWYDAVWLWHDGSNPVTDRNPLNVARRVRVLSTRGRMNRGAVRGWEVKSFPMQGRWRLVSRTIGAFQLGLIYSVQPLPNSVSRHTQSFHRWKTKRGTRTKWNHLQLPVDAVRSLIFLIVKDVESVWEAYQIILKYFIRKKARSFFIIYLFVCKIQANLRNSRNPKNEKKEKSLSNNLKDPDSVIEYIYYLFNWTLTNKILETWTYITTYLLCTHYHCNDSW